MDEVLEMLDKTTKRIQKTVDETKEASCKQISTYEQTLRSEETTQDQKTRAFIGKALELDRMERLSSQLSLLYTLQIFAFKVKVLEISVGNIDEKLKNSGALQANSELEGIKKNIDELKILVEAQYEAMKEIRESQNKNLTYIH